MTPWMCNTMWGRRPRLPMWGRRPRLPMDRSRGRLRHIGIHAALLAALALLPWTATAQELGVHDTVVAVVNKDVITRKDVFDHARAAIAALDPQLPEMRRAEMEREIIAGTLRGLVDDKLLELEGRRLLDSNETFRARVDERVRLRLEEERRQAGGELPLRDRIQARGLTLSEYSERLRSDMVREAVLYQFVLRDLSASPAELLEFYRRNAKEFQQPEQVKSRQIFIRTSNYESREKALETAQEVLSKVKDGLDFAVAAQKYSNGPRAAEGGLWDFMKRGVRPKPIDELMFSLPVDGIGGPAETEIGFTIIKVEARRPARTVPFEEVQMQIEAAITTQRRMERYQALIERLQAENYVEILN